MLVVRNNNYRLFTTELMAANITERLLSQFYMQKETGYELRQSGDTAHTRKEVTTGKLNSILKIQFILRAVNIWKIQQDSWTIVIY